MKPERFHSASELLAGDTLPLDWSEHSEFSPGIRAWAAMCIATKRRGEAYTQDFSAAFSDPTDKLPRFPSTLNYIETNLNGFYGLTTIAGRKGLGKTMLAMACAIEAAATMNWQVFYLSAELDDDEMEMRCDRYYTRHDHCVDGIPFLHIIHVPRGFDPMDYCQLVELEMDPTLPVLTVMDSVNTIAELHSDSYLHVLKEWQLWAMLARRISRGAASFLVLSELNKSGRTKGEKLEHWSDVMLTIKGKAEDGHVEMICDKSRRTKGEGPMGKYIRHVADSRFYRPDELQRMLALVEPEQEVI
jgi:predicted ATP-dependent serine protease